MHQTAGVLNRTVDSLVNGGLIGIASDDVFVHTETGVAAASSASRELPERLRMLLFLVNGRRRMNEYRDLLPRFRHLDDAFDMLLKKGFIERIKSPLGD